MALCFPTGCLKVFIGIGSVLTILIAIGMLAATIYANVEKTKIIDKGDINIANGALVALYVGSIIFLVLGLGGLYGSIKKNKLALSLFAIGTFLFILLFIAGTFIFFLAPKSIFDGTCAESKTAWVNDLGKMNAKAEQTLCQTCACKFNNIDNSYTDPQVGLLTNKSDSGVVKVQDCNEFSSLNYSESYQLLMATLETELKCGGWCENQNQIFYYYSNIATAKPSQGCYQAFKGFFEKNGNILGIGCAGALTFSLLNMIMICCLCFHPSKAGNRSDFYKRMVEDD